MPTIFLATLGQRPEAITMALDLLNARYTYNRIAILHTDAHVSGIAEAYQALMPKLHNDYQTEIISHSLCYQNGDSLIDIVDSRSAEAYHRAVLEILRDYRVEGWELHLLVAGGRKAMTVYATLAASLVFGGNDYLWTILSEESLMKKGLFHLPAGSLAGVQVVRLPFIESRLPRGVLAGRDVDSLLAQTQNSRQRFLNSLTEQEKVLLEMMQAHPYAKNVELADHLNKAEKTIEKQFSSVYAKLASYYDLEVEDNRKRQVLLDVLAARI